ncbi:MAG: hypothetical protein WAM18_14770, partial [Halobacillus sp.]|uniref:hypothetical protein n=1 Tax=Halobacillus sp. TaxID=56800 RepID=UPI003BAF95E2
LRSPRPVATSNDPASCRAGKRNRPPEDLPHNPISRNQVFNKRELIFNKHQFESTGAVNRRDVDIYFIIPEC